MRRFLAIALGVTVLAASAWVVRFAAAGSAGPATAAAAHAHVAAATAKPATPKLIDQLAQARLATAKYATNLKAAKADGYMIITRMIPDMG